MKEEEIFKLEGEIWRPVVGYEGLYEVSNYGRVASLNYYGGSRRHLLKPGYQTNGYQFVNLWKNKVKSQITIHKLVAMAFPEICGTYFEGAEIDHINGIRDDNRASNLRWVTKSLNMLNPITRKRISEAMKGKHPSEETRKKLAESGKGKHINRADQSKPVLQYTKDGTLIAEYQSIREAERQTGVQHTNISRCCLGKQCHKSAGGFNWKYAS